MEWLNQLQMISSKNFKLTQDNYYDSESEWPYQSKTWFQKFLDCEAAALAALKSPLPVTKKATPLLVGNYLHSYFESPHAHEQFIEENKDDIFFSSGKNKGKEKADFLQAEKMIESLEADDAFRKLYQGEKEVIVEGNIFGVQWKGKIDCLDLDNHVFYDLKTVDNIHKKHWNNELHQYVSFAEDRGYDTQMAVYRELIQQTFGVDCVPYIIAISKQDIPDKAIFRVPERITQKKMEMIEELQPRVEAVKNGEVKPVRCEHCDYCRSTKQLAGMRIKDIDEIEFY